jgi:hypothetical protein
MFILIDLVETIPSKKDLSLFETASFMDEVR